MSTCQTVTLRLVEWRGLVIIAPMNEPNGASPPAVVIAVPDDALDALLGEGLVEEVVILRGPAVEAAITIGVDAAALVTLMQTPSTIRQFAAWLVERAKRRANVICISGQRAGRRVELRVTGEVSVDAVAEFISAVFRELPGSPP